MAIGNPDNMTVWVGAVRYYLPRRTYAVGEMCAALRREWPLLQEDVKAIISRDIEEALTQGGYAIGDKCDRDEWESVAGLWRREG